MVVLALAGLNVLAAEVRLPATIAKQNVYEETRGVIEYFACTSKGKAYESILVIDCDAEEVCTKLLALGLKPGSPAADVDGKHILPTGDRVSLTVEWNQDGKTVSHKANEFLVNSRTGKPMQDTSWAFVATKRVADPVSNRERIAAAVSGNLIAVHHLDPAVLIQNPLAEAEDSNLYKANTALLPKEGTAVTLVIAPAVFEGRCVHAFVSGRVQGVGFRAFTQQVAKTLKLGGWVRNLDDGRVELLAQGPPAAVEKLLAEVSRGPRGAKVEKVVTNDEQPTEVFSTFEIRY